MKTYERIENEQVDVYCRRCGVLGTHRIRTFYGNSIYSGLKRTEVLCKDCWFRLSFDPTIKPHQKDKEVTWEEIDKGKKCVKCKEKAKYRIRHYDKYSRWKSSQLFCKKCWFENKWFKKAEEHVCQKRRNC